MGEVFAGRYELLEPIAEGGMGSVWVVRDLAASPAGSPGGESPDPERTQPSPRRGADHRPEILAAKLLRQSDATALLRFMREQGVRISHPHVLMPLSWAGADDRVLFTMPLVRGGSLRTLLGDFHQLPAHWVAVLMDQLLNALEAVHGTGLVHRDVKPDNLLLQPTGAGRPHLLLSDFGIAAALDGPRLTHASQVVGTDGYLPPEQARGADPDPRQDLYSACLVGLQCLTGEGPSTARRAAEVLASLQPDVAPLVAVLLEGAADEVTARPATAALLRERLRAATVLPEPWPEDGAVAYVFDHLGGAGPAPEPSGPGTASPTAGVHPSAVPSPTRGAGTSLERPQLDTTPVGPGPGGGRRVAAYSLLGVGLLLALAAAWVLLLW